MLKAYDRSTKNDDFDQFRSIIYHWSIYGAWSRCIPQHHSHQRVILQFWPQLYYFTNIIFMFTIHRAAWIYLGWKYCWDIVFKLTHSWVLVVSLITLTVISPSFEVVKRNEHKITFGYSRDEENLREAQTIVLRSKSFARAADF